MDNVTHTLVALTLARTPLGRAGRGTTAALVVASNAPDIDVLSMFGGSASYLQWHRGPTHGVLGIVGLGMAVAVIVWLALRPSRAGNPGQTAVASLPMLAALSMLGVLFHVLMDLPTSYGTRLLSPFDWHWYAVDWLPIVDIYLLAVLGAALLFGRASIDARRRNAAIATAFMALNYGVRGAAHHRALMLAPRVFGPTLPAPCDPDSAPTGVVDSWPRSAPAAPRGPAASRCLVELAAMPSFLSPFRWRVIAHVSNAYELHDLDLLDPRFRAAGDTSYAPWRTSLRYPNVWTPAVEKAATTLTAQRFLGFARFPAARTARDAAGVTLVRWTDARFAGGLLSLEQPARPRAPFEITVRVAP